MTTCTNNPNPHVNARPLSPLATSPRSPQQPKKTMSEILKKITFDTLWVIAGALVSGGVVYGVMRSESDQARRDLLKHEAQIIELQTHARAVEARLSAIDVNVEWIKRAMEKRGMSP